MTNESYPLENHDAFPKEPEAASATQAARVRARLVHALAETPGSSTLAAALRRLQKADGISPDEMAARLGTDRAGLDRLALCYAPHDDERFAEDAQQIADYCGCSINALVSVLRRVQILTAFAAQAVPASTPHPNAARTGTFGWRKNAALVAARDADEDDSKPEEGHL